MTQVVIIGAGQSGLAMSRQLRNRSIEHVVLERSSIGHAWANERWDSLQLLTPNWLSRLPGAADDSDDPDGYMSAADVVDQLQSYAVDAPVQIGVSVDEVATTSHGFEVSSSAGPWVCAAVVDATGACQRPYRPGFADQFPSAIRQLTPIEYRNPAGLGEGRVLVVGASASGAQIADELARHEVEVTLAVGRHRRMVRRYRGYDIFWWMHRIGMLDDPPDKAGVRGARPLPSLQLIGSDRNADLDLDTLSASGVRLVGRIEGIEGSVARMGTSLAASVKNAQAANDAVLDRIDQFITDEGLEVAAPDRPQPISVPSVPDELELAEFNTVIWATGFQPHHPWIEADLLDPRGGIINDGGVTPRPGLYVLGEPFSRRRRSGFIDGAGPDAADIASVLEAHLRTGGASARGA